MSDAMLTDATHHLQEALDHVGVSDDTITRLEGPRSTLKVSIPVRMDDGGLRTFPGLPGALNDSRGPTKGGIRFHPEVDVDEMQSLASG